MHGTGKASGTLFARDLDARVRELFSFTPTPAQWAAAEAMLTPAIAELETGQGKTITGALAAIQLVQSGRTVWISTANDYLARRDAQWMQPLYAALGIRVGVIAEGAPQSQRRGEYSADVVYGTLREFGFDYLRGRLAERHPAHRDAALAGADPFHNALIVDEADSLLIDEAVIPLVLSQPAGADEAVAGCYVWAAGEAPGYVCDQHYERTGHCVSLTPAGRDRLLSRPMPPGGERLSQNELIDAVERAILVNERYLRDRDYVVRDGRVQIVDEFTGRTAQGRSWSAGIHQAIEAREGLPLTRATTSAARITVQDFVRQFRQVSGMTGTAAESAREFKEVYGLRVTPIAPHQTPRRQELSPVVTPTLVEKWNAIAEEAAAMIEAGRAVLIGTRTVEASETLAASFRDRAIGHDVLNARQFDREAEIVAGAGQPGRVTIATNMAGRGTDIRLADSVRAAGGLHVIITELNASPRIDRQLIGRCGRQGDPGSYRFILSEEDPIAQLAFETIEPSSSREGALRRLRKAQEIIERRQLEARRLLRLSSARREMDARTLGLDPVLDPLED